VIEEAKDLRPGNINEAPCFDIPREQIYGIRVDDKCFGAISSYGIYRLSDGYQSFKPVPLSDAWLIYLGCIKTIGDNIWTDYKLSGYTTIYGIHTKAGFYFVEQNGSRWCLYQSTDEDTTWEICSDIKWVHKLQNLIYELTGEELKNMS